MREHLRVVAKRVRHAERVAHPSELVGYGAAGGDELGTRYLARQHRCVPATETAESGDADLQFSLIHSHPVLRKKPRGLAAGLLIARCRACFAYIRSMIAAMPWPPPMHMVMSA